MAEHNGVMMQYSHWYTSAGWLFEGKGFGDRIDLEKGNFDYLMTLFMGCSLDIGNPDVQQELVHWGEWLLDTTGVDGFRFDEGEPVQQLVSCHKRSRAGNRRCHDEAVCRVGVHRQRVRRNSDLRRHWQRHDTRDGEDCGYPIGG